MDAQLIKQFQEFQAFKDAMETKAPGTGQSGQLVHGPTGLFSQRGLNPEIFSAMLQPRGIAAALQQRATVFTNPQYGILTGQEADAGTEPDDSCDDPVRAGFRKMCSLTAQFGFLRRGTDTIDPSRIIQLLNRSEFTDLTLQGDAVNDDTGFMPVGNFNDPMSVLNNAVSSNLSAVATSFIRVLSQQAWQGVNAGGTEGFQEMIGLDSQITTGHVDSVTNTTCPAADSDVKDFNFEPVDGTGLNDIVNYLSMLEFFVVNNANRTGLTVNWAIAMRPELWQELTAVWPIAYNTNRGTILAGNNRLVVDGREMVTDRDNMRRSLTIEINARTYKVILDDGINELTNTDNANIPAGEFASDIYFVPLTANGFAVTRLEYLDYRRIMPMLDSLGQGKNSLRFWTNDGRYLWTVQDTRECFDVTGRTEQRIICQTPQLAGRIQNVRYAPLQHLRSPYPDSAYFVNGGVSTRADFSDNNAVWA